MVTSLFTYIVHSEKKIARRKMHNIDKRKKNIDIRKKKVKKKENTQKITAIDDRYTVEFSIIFIMKQDFDISALGYHC